MPKHVCIDPQDPYAQREVLIEFGGSPFSIHLIRALDVWNVDILPDLVEEQRKDLKREIAADYNFRDQLAYPITGPAGNRSCA
ncbi:protein of unknown function [Methylorubrum extorquens DM4]|uniref:Uncharacterized protein n=1 Tax=Methylorubrum extorquens (strain DSM 6343 / CIP 106787 / DM4) TaxID=661410 RepID=C7CCB0_METED|nr:hypothetical protein [Methylorubrum extorquens]CAX22456.1 protein of unknown function [Methylorubrum extorquens DM4]